MRAFGGSVHMGCKLYHRPEPPGIRYQHARLAQLRLESPVRACVVRACMYAYMHACVHACMRACVRSTPACAYTYTRSHAHTRVLACACTRGDRVRHGGAQQDMARWGMAKYGPGMAGHNKGQSTGMAPMRVHAYVCKRARMPTYASSPMHGAAGCGICVPCMRSRAYVHTCTPANVQAYMGVWLARMFVSGD